MSTMATCECSTAVVTATGMQTEIGQPAVMIQVVEEEETPFAAKAGRSGSDAEHCFSGDLPTRVPDWHSASAVDGANLDYPHGHRVNHDCRESCHRCCTGRLAYGLNHLSGIGPAGDGEAPCSDSAPASCGNAGLGYRDLLSQDQHADTESDDRDPDVGHGS